ncbi:MAG: hypothetical protein DMD41_04360 [Gemmatimonadetes bacterium]|nr:MAG: hypothetical protein DMD41_04360 [Gemmatimonadota bacterium]
MNVWFSSTGRIQRLKYVESLVNIGSLSASRPVTVCPTWIMPATRPKPRHEESGTAGRVPRAIDSRYSPSSARALEFAYSR